MRDNYPEHFDNDRTSVILLHTIALYRTAISCRFMWERRGEGDNNITWNYYRRRSNGGEVRALYNVRQSIDPACLSINLVKNNRST